MPQTLLMIRGLYDLKPDNFRGVLLTLYANTAA